MGQYFQLDTVWMSALYMVSWTIMVILSLWLPEVGFMCGQNFFKPKIQNARQNIARK